MALLHHNHILHSPKTLISKTLCNTATIIIVVVWLVFSETIHCTEPNGSSSLKTNIIRNVEKEMITYSQSMNTQFVSTSDYPSTNVASFSSNLKLYWKLLKNEKSSDINDAILEFGAVAKNTRGYVSFCFGYLNRDPMSGDTSKFFSKHGKQFDFQLTYAVFGYYNSASQSVTIMDAWMVSKPQSPVSDASDDILQRNGGFRVVGSVPETHIKWTRYVRTGDSYDVTFTNSAMKTSWTLHSTSTGMVRHTSTGKGLSLNFLSAGYATGEDGNIIVSSLTKLVNSYRWHLIATAFICGLLVLGGFLLSVIAPRMNPNLFLDLFLYRRLTKQVNVRFIGIFINTFLDLTFGESIVIGCYWVLIAIWFAFGYLNSTSAEVGKAFASVCVFNFGLILFPVTRYSVLQVLFGISFDRAIKYHRCLGILQWIFVTAHGVAMVIHYYASGTYLVDITPPSFPILGIIAWFLMTCLWLLTFPVIRRKLWELFLVSHVVLSILIVILSIIHGSGYINLLPYMALSILFYLFDVFLRIVFGFGVPTSIVSMVYDDKSQVTTITMRKRFLTFGSNPHLGHFIFLYIPAISKYQHHPITVSSCKEVEGGLKRELEFTVHVKNFGSGWSKQVALIAEKETPTDLFCRVEGAYGSLSVPLMRYKTIVLFGGGIGATPVNAIYTHLLETNVQDKTIYTCWSIPTLEMIKVFPNLLKGSSSNFKPNIFVSKLTHDSHDPRIHKGRANPKQFLEQIKKELKDKGVISEYIGVLVCGPEQLVSSVSNAVWDEHESGIRFHLHKEVFTW